MIARAEEEFPRLSVRRLCALLGVGRSWYYAPPGTPTRAERDVALRDAIERLVLEFPGYGYRRVTKALQREGWTINHKRVLRVMRQESLLCHLKRRFVVTTDSGHALQTYSNLAAEFEPTGPDQLWVADISYIRLPTTFVYLACILDAWSRRCVGWRVAPTIDTQLTLAALDQALATRRPAPGLIHHSDRGVQYAGGAYVARLEEVGARISMAAVGNPYENAKAESFFKTLKYEEVYLQQYRTLAEAEGGLGRFITDVYNAKRLHSSLGYASPVEVEAAHGVGRGSSMTAPEQELTRLEHAWMEAVRRKDTEALERILAPEYAYTASGQGRWSRQGWLETVAIYDLHRFEFVEVDVRPYGDVAVVLSQYRQDASVGGAPRSGEFQITDVWVRRDESWQVVARSSILLPEAA
jgi:transposase InsO family protein/ketosteroid isomerase-like protein